MLDSWRICTSICMYVCMYVCMYACMYIKVCLCMCMPQSFTLYFVHSEFRVYQYMRIHKYLHAQDVSKFTHQNVGECMHTHTHIHVYKHTHTQRYMSHKSLVSTLRRLSTKTTDFFNMAHWGVLMWHAGMVSMTRYSRVPRHTVSNLHDLHSS